MKKAQKMDVDSLSQDQVDALGVELGVKLRDICDNTAKKVNSILKAYGMTAKIAIAFDSLPQNAVAIKAPGKKSKQSNL